MKPKERLFTLLAPGLLVLSVIPMILIKLGVGRQLVVDWFEWYTTILAVVALLVSFWGIHLIMGAIDEKRRRNAFSLFISLLVACVPWTGLALTYIFPVKR
jgi:hypothetical protein